MTNSEKKAFLRRYGDNEREIKRLEEEIARWESRAEKVTASYSLAPAHGADGDKVQVAVDNIAEVKAMLYDRLTDATELRRSIQAAIGTVEDARLRNLLEYRYIEGMTFERIAVEMDVTYVHTCRLHGNALNLLNVIECYT
ncbi:MAG: sigma factor-like helix-turn-helix DNA-binding protein [Candidatus Fimivivens sp.]|nr:sigma factor-like helix-turn-helix DNA-binding protein [Candidatus Fimivivens sp.]